MGHTYTVPPEPATLQQAARPSTWHPHLPLSIWLSPTHPLRPGSCYWNPGSHLSDSSISTSTTWGCSACVSPIPRGINLQAGPSAVCSSLAPAGNQLHRNVLNWSLSDTWALALPLTVWVGIILFPCGIMMAWDSGAARSRIHSLVSLSHHAGNLGFLGVCSWALLWAPLSAVFCTSIGGHFLPHLSRYQDEFGDNPFCHDLDSRDGEPGLPGGQQKALCGLSVVRGRGTHLTGQL